MSVNETGEYPAPASCFKYVPRGYTFVKVYVLVLITVVIMIASLVGIFNSGGDEGMRYAWFALLASVTTFWIPPPSLDP